MLHLIRQPIAAPDESLRVVALRADRRTIAKRLWRGRAEDGSEFGFELDAPLRHGDTFAVADDRRYVVDQTAEPLLEIALDQPASAAAGIGWAIGNLHLELSAEATRLLTPDEPSVRQLLDRLAVPFRLTHAVFRPGRFVRGNVLPHELGASHRH